MSDATHHYEQAGLEITEYRPQSQEGLEVALPLANWLHPVQVEENEGYKKPGIGADEAGGRQAENSLPEKRWNTKRIILLAAGCFIIIVAIVVGVVVGVVVKPGKEPTDLR